MFTRSVARLIRKDAPGVRGAVGTGLEAWPRYGRGNPHYGDGYHFFQGDTPTVEVEELSHDYEEVI